MGLDMYVSRKKYLGWNYEHNRKNVKLPNLKKFGVDVEKVSSVEMNELYWRKVNHVHKWFVDHVQKGVDDCGEYPVEKSDFESLLSDVDEVLKDKTMAQALLPRKEGFFFGSKEYDEWYFQDLEETKKGVEELLKNWDGGSDYYYSSSLIENRKNNMPPKKHFKIVFKSGHVVWVKAFNTKEARILAQARAIEAGQIYQISTIRLVRSKV